MANAHKRKKMRSDDFPKIYLPNRTPGFYLFTLMFKVLSSEPEKRLKYVKDGQDDNKRSYSNKLKCT